jgi:hypothetical protein
MECSARARCEYAGHQLHQHLRSNGTQSFGFYEQGLEGQTDTVTAAITATASGFTTGNGTADVVPAGFDVIRPAGSPTAGGRMSPSTSGSRHCQPDLPP